MNKLIENAMRTRETGMATSFIRELDIITGSVVQVKPGKHHAGKVGIVTGVVYLKKNDDLRFNVQFSDREAALFSGERLELVRGSEKHKLKMLQTRFGSSDDSGRISKPAQDVEA